MNLFCTKEIEFPPSALFTLRESRQQTKGTQRYTRIRRGRGKKRLKGEKRERSRDNEERQTKTEKKRGTETKSKHDGGKQTNKQAGWKRHSSLVTEIWECMCWFCYTRRRQIAALSERLSWDQTPREMRGRLEQPWHQTWQEPWVSEIPDSHTEPGLFVGLSTFHPLFITATALSLFSLVKKPRWPCPSCPLTRSWWSTVIGFLFSFFPLKTFRAAFIYCVFHAQTDRRDRLCFIMKQISRSLNIPS